MWSSSALNEESTTNCSVVPRSRRSRSISSATASGGRRRRRAPSRPRVGAVHAAVRAAARRLHAGGAIPAGAGEHARRGRREGRCRRGRRAAARRCPREDRPSAIRRAATSPSPTTPSRTSSARRISRGKIENAGPPRTIRACGAAARTVSATRAYQLRVGVRVRPGGVVGVAQREPDRVGAPGLQLGPQRREGPPVEARVEDAGPAAGGLHRRSHVERPDRERRLGELLAVGDDDEDTLHRPSMDYLGRRCVGRAPASRRQAELDSPGAADGRVLS